MNGRKTYLTAQMMQLALSGQFLSLLSESLSHVVVIVGW